MSDQSQNQVRVSGPMATAMRVRPISASALLKILLLAFLMALAYRIPLEQMVGIWRLKDSYYSHGFLVLPISLYFVWRRRKELMEAPPSPNLWGYPFLIGAAMLLVLGAFLSFGVFGQFSLVPMLLGLVLTLLGTRHLKLLAFPILFLLFMIPIPSSMTSAIAFDLKLIAMQLAVFFARAMTIPLVQEGSFVHFGDDQLLVGDVCGGLRSLISLLAIGVLVAYLSKAKPWARILTLALSAPIAVVANVVRIVLLCVVGYFWGSNVATGLFHDVSGILVYAIAIILFFILETYLPRRAPSKEDSP